MRIISNFRDFYDCLQSTDEDRKTLYIRKPEEIEIERENWPFPLIEYCFGSTVWVMNVTQYIIGFCGKIYPLIELDASELSKPVFCWNFQQTDAFLRRHLKPYDLARYLGKNTPKRRRRRYGKTGEMELKKFFLECEQKKGDFKAMFEAKRCPIFVAHAAGYPNWKIVYNAELKPFEFFRLFNSQSAYQEILMFMSNLAVPLKPIPEIDDVTMAQAKGFNKFSFRKDPIRRRR